uniref:Uncharacterized protein n=1 Tax=Bicosoecida sp. CB-2014 TaxID=1486930 RepID=A0A7S1C2I7_9STRA|mmetsp:Transcript_11375/g.39676  ORF Transcript_11375/g.39676 Transcript_11375/m.39676 type:complete len:343 (+) Transcript_11375:193-1221(+)
MNAFRSVLRAGSNNDDDGSAAGGEYDDEHSMPSRERNNSSRKPPPDRLPAAALGSHEVDYTDEVGWCTPFGALLTIEWEEVRPWIRKARQGEMVAMLVLSMIAWIFGLSVSGTGLFHDNVYAYDSSACECIVVNSYFGMFFVPLQLALCCVLPFAFIHDPDGGAHGPGPDGGDEAFERKTTTRVFRHPHLACCGSVVLTPIVVFISHMVVTPLSFIVTYYVWYGIAFCFLLLGICRAECESDVVMASGQWGGDMFVGFYEATFDSSGVGWPNGNGTMLIDWKGVGGYEPGVVTLTQFVWMLTGLYLLIAWSVDLVLYCRIVGRRRGMLKRRVARGYVASSSA